MNKPHGRIRPVSPCFQYELFEQSSWKAVCYLSQAPSYDFWQKTAWQSRLSQLTTHNHYEHSKSKLQGGYVHGPQCLLCSVNRNIKKINFHSWRICVCIAKVSVFHILCKKDTFPELAPWLEGTLRWIRKLIGNSQKNNISL